MQINIFTINIHKVPEGALEDIMNKTLVACFVGLSLIIGVVLGAALISISDRDTSKIKETVVDVAEIITDVVEVIDEGMEEPKEEIEIDEEVEVVEEMVEVEYRPACGDFMVPYGEWPKNAPWQPPPAIKPAPTIKPDAV